MNRRKKILISFLCIFSAVLLLGSLCLFYFAASIYNDSFNYRCETDWPHSLSEFPDLVRSRHTFSSGKGQLLVGYLYESGDPAIEPKGTIVFAHGLGSGGQAGYMDIFNHFAAKGYYVFAYDATGNDESEGEAIGGLPQGIIDIDYAIRYAKTIEKIRHLPFALMGYSWGGLSVANALNYHPDAAAVVSLAGFNRSVDLIDYQGRQVAGEKARLLVPFASLYEFTKYGKYAFSTAMKGFEKSDCAVMIVHGDADTTVPIEYGYETYYKKYAEDPRFLFKKYEGCGHDILTGSHGEYDRALMDEIVAFLDHSIIE